MAALSRGQLGWAAAVIFAFFANFFQHAFVCAEDVSNITQNSVLSSDAVGSGCGNCTDPNSDRSDQDDVNNTTSTNVQSHMDSEFFFYVKGTDYVTYIGDYVIRPVGVVANMISLCVMNLKHNRKLTICLCMSFLAISDSIVLPVGSLTELVYFIAEDMFGDTSCKCHVFVHHMFASFGSFTIVLMTFDKFCAVVFPHKAKMLSTRGRVLKFTFLNIVVVTILYIPLIFTAGAEHSLKFCSRHLYIKGWLVDVYFTSSVVFYPLIPAAAILLMNTGIIRVIYQRKLSNLTSRASNKSQDRQLTIMLLLVSFIFILLTLPFEIRGAFFNNRDPDATKIDMIKKAFNLNITYQFMILNFAINFFLYLLSGTKFRNDLKTLFRIKSEGPTGDSQQPSIQIQ